MFQNNLELSLKYPLISSEILNGRKRYSGSILCGVSKVMSHVLLKSWLFKNKDVHIQVVEETYEDRPCFTHTATVDTDVDAKITSISARNIVEYLDKLSVILKKECNVLSKNFVNVYRKVIHEYSEFTAFHLTIKRSHISTDLSKINVVTVDEGGREHTLEIQIDFNTNKDIFHPENLDLPEVVATSFKANFSSLTEVYSKFLAAVDSLQPFFDIMDDLDGSCCILDPASASKKYCYRRIWLGHNASVMVIIDPLNVKIRPELKFLGPEKQVDLYLQRLSLKLEAWCEDTSLVQDLLNILDLESFPSKPEKIQDVLIHAGECSICFSSRLCDQLPDIICSNKSCETFYHANCLHEWLSSVNSKRIFNQLHGHCPNCEKGISCPIPDAVNGT